LISGCIVEESQIPPKTCNGYAVGETWGAADGCNTCTCTETGVACTEIACEPEEKDLEDAVGEVDCVDYDNDQENCLLHEECKWTPDENICEPIGAEDEFDNEDEEKTEIPTSYHIENVPHYGEIEFCYGSSMMMLLGYYGFSEEEVQEYRTFVKSEGAGGPPDMFLDLDNLDVMEEIKIGYSKLSAEDAEFYEGLVNEPERQIVLFDSQNKAFENLKRLVSSDVPVIVLIHYGNHYVVVTGYDEDYIYTNDPGFDYSYTYKIDSNPELKQRRIAISDFLDEWNISAQEETVGEAIGFPGDYGTIWFDFEIN
jgi:hypothetical protein